MVQDSRVNTRMHPHALISALPATPAVDPKIARTDIDQREDDRLQQLNARKLNARTPPPGSPEVEASWTSVGDGAEVGRGFKLGNQLEAGSGMAIPDRYGNYSSAATVRQDAAFEKEGGIEAKPAGGLLLSCLPFLKGRKPAVPAAEYECGWVPNYSLNAYLGGNGPDGGPVDPADPAGNPRSQVTPMNYNSFGQTHERRGPASVGQQQAGESASSPADIPETAVDPAACPAASPAALDEAQAALLIQSSFRGKAGRRDAVLSKVIWEGPLVKQSGGKGRKKLSKGNLVRTSESRFFVLSGKTLSWYEASGTGSGRAGSMKGCLDLDAKAVVSMPAGPAAKAKDASRFTLTATDSTRGTGEPRELRLRAANSAEAACWIQQIESIVRSNGGMVNMTKLFN